MRILALDLGKYKSVACDYEAETGRHRFTTIATNLRGWHSERAATNERCLAECAAPCL